MLITDNKILRRNITQDESNPMMEERKRGYVNKLSRPKLPSQNPGGLQFVHQAIFPICYAARSKAKRARHAAQKKVPKPI